MGGADSEAREVLSDELGRLFGNAAFTGAEFAADGVTIFEISRDLHGTPTALSWKYAYEDGALRVGEHDRWSEDMADPERFYRRVAPKFIVRTQHPLPGRLNDLLADAGQVPVYRCLKSLRDLLRTAVIESPLVLGYELAVLKRVATGRTGAGQIALTGQPLFWQGDARGSRVGVRVIVEPTDDDGTVFAVVTREPRPDLPRLAQELRPLQIQAADLPPGSYDLAAVLSRPGLVQFEGLPVSLRASSRSWDELKRLVPGQLPRPVPAHLVCLIEVCGGEDQLQQRTWRLEELITTAQDGTVPLRVSVIAYGAHGVAWRVEDRPPEVRAWAVSGDEAIKALRGLAGRRVDKREYQRAAQLECALKLLREHLSARDGRPVIVTAGGRPAHPPGLDTGTQIIPCPDWVDGMSELGRLAALPGITLGAIRDPRCRGEIWERLGQDAMATVNDAVDMDSFVGGLGLRVDALTVPFPVIEQ
jgi:hypothetical protein